MEVFMDHLNAILNSGIKKVRFYIGKMPFIITKEIGLGHKISSKEIEVDQPKLK